MTDSRSNYNQNKGERAGDGNPRRALSATFSRKAERLNTSYHKDASHVNKTDVSSPSVDFALVSNTLRRTFSTIHRLTARYGFCFASLSRIAEYCACSLSTIRKHVARLLKEGMIRREEVPGYADRFFICPMMAWKNPPSVAQNGRTQRTSEALKATPELTTKQLQPAPAPACPAVVTSPPPVVVSAATPQIQGEEIPDEISDVEPVSHNERLQPDAAPAPVSALVSSGDQPLTPEQTATAREASAAGVPWKLAQAAVLEDSRRAQETLRALLAEQKRRDVRNPGAWFRVAFREAWEFGAKPQPGMASAAHLVAVPVGHNAVVPPPDAEADAVRSSMIAALRQRMGPRTRA